MREWTIPWVDDCCVRFVVPEKFATEVLRRELEAELGQVDHINGLNARLEWLASDRGLRVRRLPDWSTGPYGETVIRFGLEPLTRLGRPVRSGTGRPVPSPWHRA